MNKDVLVIIVETRLVGSPTLEKTFEINQYDHEDRRRLARHCWWAMHNNRAVTTYAKK